MKKKIYCERCQHWTGRGAWTLDRCATSDNVYEEDTPKARVKWYKQKPENMNANNDCSSYKLNRQPLYFILVMVVVSVALFSICFVPIL